MRKYTRKSPFRRYKRRLAFRKMRRPGGRRMARGARPCTERLYFSRNITNSPGQSGSGITYSQFNLTDYTNLAPIFGNPVFVPSQKYILREIRIRWIATIDSSEEGIIGNRVQICRPTKNAFNGFSFGVFTLANGTDFVSTSSGDPQQLMFNPRRVKTLYSKSFSASTTPGALNAYEGQADGGSVFVQKRGYVKLKPNQMLNNYVEGGTNSDWRTLTYEPVASRNIFLNLWTNNSTTDLEGVTYNIQCLYVIDRLA